jgi:hypothetical protein
MVGEPATNTRHREDRSLDHHDTEQLQRRLAVRAAAAKSVLGTGLVVEECSEQALSVLRRWGRALLRLVGRRPPPSTRRRPARPDELAAARETLQRTRTALACIMHERRGGKRGNASGARRMRV